MVRKLSYTFETNGGSVCESNAPETGLTRLPPVLKTGRFTGTHSLPQWWTPFEQRRAWRRWLELRRAKKTLNSNCNSTGGVIRVSLRPPFSNPVPHCRCRPSLYIDFVSATADWILNADVAVQGHPRRRFLNLSEPLVRCASLPISRHHYLLRYGVSRPARRMLTRSTPSGILNP
jgi:hypothetical protein